MLIPRLLVFPALLGLCAAPLMAQDSQPKAVANSIKPPQNTQQMEVQQFKLSRNDNSDLSRVVTGPAIRAGALELGQDDVTCYSIRSYRVARINPKSDTTRPAGHSTCVAANKFQTKAVLNIPSGSRVAATIP